MNILNSFRFELPTKIEYGVNVSQKFIACLDELGSNRTFIVTDQGIKSSGLLDRFIKQLQDEHLSWDIFDDVEAIIVDDKDAQNKIYKFVKHIAPEYTHKVMLYQDAVNIFDHYNINKQIDSSLEKRVNLKSGGSLIIESTEAMTVVDVNTGRFIGKTNLEDTILKAKEKALEKVCCNRN